MLNPVRHATRTNSSSIGSTTNIGHVCLSCRRRRQQQIRSTRRWASTTASAQQQQEQQSDSASIAEDYFSNFNNLSKEYRSSVPAKRREKKQNASPHSTKAGRDANEARMRIGKREAKEASVSQSSTSDVELLRSSIKSKLKELEGTRSSSSQSPDADRGPLYRSLNERSRDVGDRRASGLTWRTQAPLAAREGKSSDTATGSGARVPIGGHSTMSRLALDGRHGTHSRDSLVRKISVSNPQGRAEADAGGIPLADQEPKVRKHRLGDPLPESERLADGSATGSRVYSLIAKVKAMVNKPKWGALLESTQETSSTKTIEDFDSLRNADKVSPPTQYTTSTGKPYGLAHAATHAKEEPGLGDGWLEGQNMQGDSDTGKSQILKSESVEGDANAGSKPERKTKKSDANVDETASGSSTVNDAHEVHPKEGENQSGPSKKDPKKSPQEKESQANSSTAKASKAEKAESTVSKRRKVAEKSKVQLLKEKRTAKAKAKAKAEATVKAKTKAKAVTPVQNRAERRAAKAKERSAQEANKRSKIATPVEDQSMADMEDFLRIKEDVKASRKASVASAKKAEPRFDAISGSASEIATIEAKGLVVTPLDDIKQPPVPPLSHGLDRVLFSQGVYQLQDPHSRVFNFDPYLQKIMPVVEFDFNALKEYKTSSQDTTLSAIAKDRGKKYIGSTSSMTGTLGHFHYLLSDFRPLNCNMMSRGFPERMDTFTALNRAPNAMFLRWKNGTYAIDADKQYDSGNVLMMLGKSMEKLLTLPKDEYERYRKSDHRNVPEEETNAAEAFQYTTMGDFLMRSQLDAHDPRLPGTGMFDLKTRAVVSVRMDTRDFEPMTGYEIHTLQGRFESYEREYFDMMRSTMLKYMLQARMGRMDGIFLAYHNVQRIFGFQYLPMGELDRALHGQIDPCLGDQEFKLSVDLLNKILDKATAKFPEQSMRFHFETKQEPFTAMYIYAEPMEDEEIDKLQNTGKDKIAEFERSMLGMDDPVAGKLEQDSTAEVEPEQTEPDAEAAVPTVTAGDSEQTASSSVSSADQAFLSSIESSADVKHKPIFAATLLCKSRVNGAYAQPRVSNLGLKDDWTVEYLLNEIEDPKDAWAMYESAKARRKEAFDKANNEPQEGDEGMTEKQENAYLKFLREISVRGRTFRGKMDKLEANQEVVVFGRPVRPVDEQSIRGVEDYMDWLYKGGA